MEIQEASRGGARIQPPAPGVFTTALQCPVLLVNWQKPVSLKGAWGTAMCNGN